MKRELRGLSPVSCSTWSELSDYNEGIRSGQVQRGVANPGSVFWLFSRALGNLPVSGQGCRLGRRQRPAVVGRRRKRGTSLEDLQVLLVWS